VKRWEIRRLELAEEGSRIQLGTLRRAAEGLGCELVYGLVPKEGTLEELAAAQTEVREAALEKRRYARNEPLLKFIDWRESMMKGLRAHLRKEGYRVRPAKTDRGVAEEMAQFERNVKLLKMAGTLGPFIREFMEEREKAKRGRGARLIRMAVRGRNSWGEAGWLGLPFLLVHSGERISLLIG
jgi:hypothetical protein